MECQGTNGNSVTATADSKTITCDGQNNYFTSPRYSPGTYNVVVTNTSTEKANIYWWACSDAFTTCMAGGGPFEVPAASVCSAEISDVELGEMSRGQSSSTALNVTKDGNGTSVITFTGTELYDDGIVYLGGKSSGVTITPTGSGYISGASWVSDGSHNTIPLVLKVGSAATTGILQSVLNAKLSCK